MKTYTLTEVAKFLGISTQTARKLNIPGVLIGKRKRFTEDGIREFIRSCERGGAQ